ncbi:MAG: dienelactone hydrolase family protein [Alphaproteobacteria bacterium]
MKAYIALPEKPNGAGIVLSSSLWGINSDLRETTDYFAKLGYAVIAPNLFWRLKENHGIDYDFKCLNDVMALMKASNDPNGMTDLRAALVELRRNVTFERAGIIGWCYGGRIACLFATEDIFDSVVGIYPTFLETRLDISQKITCALSIHLAGIEQYSSMENAGERIEEAFAGKDKVELFAYPGVRHGFDFAPPHPDFNHSAARLCDSRVALFLKRTLARPEG